MIVFLATNALMMDCVNRYRVANARLGDWNGDFRELFIQPIENQPNSWLSFFLTIIWKAATDP
ncbi:MAG: hypothetical protein B7C24_08950 [Bacteroidetes bacterium 4572_77]|nr:MAG: hypothetical protein B7C24_08950 [Bacteroidetes bacterium 4572_77]